MHQQNPAEDAVMQAKESSLQYGLNAFEELD